MDGHYGFCEVIGGWIREWSCLRRVRDDSGILSVQYHERAFLRGAVDVIVMRELSQQEPVTPVGLSVIDKDAEELLHFLVDSFCLSVGLRVEHHGGVQGDVKHSVEFSHKLGDELWTSV